MFITYLIYTFTHLLVIFMLCSLLFFVNKDLLGKNVSLLYQAKVLAKGM